MVPHIDIFKMPYIETRCQREMFQHSLLSNMLVFHVQAIAPVFSQVSSYLGLMWYSSDKGLLVSMRT